MISTSGISFEVSKSVLHLRLGNGRTGYSSPARYRSETGTGSSRSGMYRVSLSGTRNGTGPVFCTGRPGTGSSRSGPAIFIFFFKMGNG